jgi:sugar lactone lactonase YvrE
MAGRMNGSLRLVGPGLGVALTLMALPGLTAPRPAAKPAPPRPAAPAPRAPEVLPAVPPPGNLIMPVSEVRAGMKGYGLTVFRGTRIERFEVEIVSVMPKANLDRPLILVNLSGGPISRRGAYLIQGMSGSPIYVNGKLLGAFSMGNAWPKEPQGMVTPIEDMLEALDPRLSETPAGLADASPEPLPDAPVAAARGFRPMALPVMVSGLTGARLERAAALLGRYNLQVAAGPGPMEQPFAADLVPGAAVGVALMTGDVDMTAIGTVTYRNGDKLLAFGHPMMQIGPAQFPLTTAFIHEVFPGFQVSHKIGSAGEITGTLTQDRPFSVAGRVGPPPTMIPVRVSVSDKATGRDRVFNIRTANHPLLVGQLLPMAVNQSIFNVRPVPGDAFARIRMKVETANEGTLTRENVAFDASQIDVTAVRDLSELLQTLTTNAFRREPVRSLEFDITLEDRRPTATVDRIFLSQETVKPGEEVEVGVVLRPYRKEPVVLRTRVKVPESAANGRAVLMVQGGSTRLVLAPPGGGIGGGPVGGAAPPPDANLRQVLRRFLERERNDQLAVRMLFPTTAVNVNGERLSGLPSTIVDVMRTSKSTGFRIERDETKALVDTQYVVQGVQMLQVTVQKDDHLERPRPSGPGSGGGGVGFTPPGGVSLSPLSAGDDDLSALQPNAIRLSIDGRPHLLRLTPEEEERERPGRAGRTPARAEPTPPAAPARPEEKPAERKEPEADAKLVGRVAKQWVQSTQADFERGTLTNTAVTTAGEIQLAPGLRLAAELNEQFVWSVAGVGDAVYAGTGNGGVVMRVTADKAEPFFSTGELAVHALARDAAGNLYAGTSPNGRVFRITPDGKGTEVLSLNGARPATEAGGKFVLCLVAGADGAIYAGTGPEGRIFRLRPGQPAEEMAKLPADCVTALTPTPDGGLYAGTAETGAVFRVEPDGRARVLYDTDQAVISGLALDRAGNVYAACAPSGEVYRITPAGAPTVHFNKGKGALYDLKIDSGGNLYTCSANAVLRIEPDGTATFLTDRRNGQFTCLAWDEQGRLSAGSSNIGSVFRLAVTVSGSFESTVHDARLPARWGRVRFTASMPPGAVLTIQTRSGNSPEPDANWSEWKNLDQRDTSQFVASPEARFLQYRLLMQAERGSPGLRDISIAYLPRNQAPRLTLAAPVGGELWRGAQTLKWSAADPDGDTLTYEVSYSGDGGRSWKPVGERPAETALVRPSEAGPPTRAGAEEALRKFREQLDKNPDLTPAQREESLQKAKALIEGFFKENPPAPDRPAPTPAPAAPGSTGRPAGTTRQASLTWDTSQVEDGVYLLRIVVTDRASNPNEALQDVKITEPFVVNNTPPQLFVFEKGVTVGEEAVEVTGMAAGRVSLKGAQYRLNGGDWSAIDADDGLWDSAAEPFRFRMPRPAAGPHSLEVKVVDAAGNVSTATVKFTVPAAGVAPAGSS